MRLGIGSLVSTVLQARKSEATGSTHISQRKGTGAIVLLVARASTSGTKPRSYETVTAFSMCSASQGPASVAVKNPW